MTTAMQLAPTAKMATPTSSRRRPSAKLAPAPVPVPNHAVVMHYHSAVVRRECSCGGSSSGEECEECAKLRRSTGRLVVSHADRALAPKIVHDVLQIGGSRLDSDVIERFTPHFGADLERVRIHNDAQAARSAAAVGAEAYTVGRDIVFGAGRYTPHTRAGQELLAHELAHVAQQRGAVAAPDLQIGSPHDSAEREAESVARSIVSGVRPNANTPATVMRKAVEGGTCSSAPAEDENAQMQPPEQEDEGAAMAKSPSNTTAVLRRFTLDGFSAGDDAAMRAAIPLAASTVKSCKGLKRTVVPAITDNTYHCDKDSKECGHTLPFPWADIYIGPSAFNYNQCCALASTIAHEAAHTQFYTESEARKLECDCFSCSC